MTDRTRAHREDHRGARWGVASTATGSAGIAPRSDWSTWVGDGRLPDSGAGSGFDVDFADDLALLAENGIGSMRWTIDWARLEPHQGRWDTDAVDHVIEVLRAARANGISVWAVLHDGPLPGWFTDDQRGWDDDDALRLTWPRHVDRVAETFGDLVDAWVPVLDPYTRALEGNLVATRPPGRHDPEKFVETLRSLHLATAEAWRLLRSGDPKVVCCIDTCPPEPAVKSREPDEREAARERSISVDRIRFGSWMRTLRDGVVSIPGLAEIEIDGLAGGYDIVGFTYRGAQSLFADGTIGPYPIDATVGADGRAPWTEGLGLTVRRLADELPGREFALLGTGLVAQEDDWRSEIVERSVDEIRQASDDGITITDAFWESGIDGWTPECGLTVPDGLIDRSRNPRPSLAMLRGDAT